MSNGRLSGSTGRHPEDGGVTTAQPLDAAAINAGVRRVSVTHDGRPIGWTEPLESERALRLAANRRLWLIQKNAKARENSRAQGRVSQAQKASITKRAKGKRG